MKILTLNSGSSSIKSQYFIDERHIATILIEKIGQSSATSHIVYDAHEEIVERHLPNHHKALQMLFEVLGSHGILENIDALDAVVHRVVHGGDIFTEPALVTDEVLETIYSLIPLAPLHNPANLEGMQIIHRDHPHIPQVAVFDTSFHQSMPAEAYTYPLPHELCAHKHIRRYGFHGSSHAYLAKEAARFLDIPLQKLDIITLHLGNGASAAAIKGGRSIDTSMGFTPLEGLMMGTRSGDIDPAIIIHLSRSHGMSIEQIDTLLNKKSGLLGVAGSSDMRDVIEGAERGDPLCSLALDIYIYRIVKYIGAYFVILGRLDAIVFSGGIGEHSPLIRQRIADRLAEPLGITIDKELNGIRDHAERTLHTPDSRIALAVIPTNEELEMAREARRVLEVHGC